MVGGREVFHLLAKAANTLEFPVRGGKAVFNGGHGFGGGNDWFLNGLQKDHQGALFPLSIEGSGRLIGLLLR